jgi:hypothetical protein
MFRNDPVPRLYHLFARVHAFARRRLGRDRVVFVCVCVLGMSLSLLAVSFVTADGGRTVFGPNLGADYTQFYAAGTILNRGRPDQLYNFELQNRLFHETLPGVENETEQTLPYVYPPFVAFVMRPLALVPYTWSFAAWLVISAGLYVAGLALILKQAECLSRADRLTAFLLALSFEPFVMECWLGGQLSAVSFFALALAFGCWQTGRPVAAGCALALCLYKPTFLVLLLPMLAVGRCWRVLAGFLAAALALAGISLLAVGPQTCIESVNVLVSFAQLTTERGGAVFQLPKYADLSAFFGLLLGHHPLLNRALLLAVAAAPLLLLAAAWRRVGRGGADYRRLLWGSTLVWTLVVNVYVGLYDTVLAAAAALLAAAACATHDRDGRPSLPPGFQALLVLLYVVPWVTQPLARAIGFQPYTLVLLALGVYLLARTRRLAAAGLDLGRETSGSLDGELDVQEVVAH